VSYWRFSVGPTKQNIRDKAGDKAGTKKFKLKVQNTLKKSLQIGRYKKREVAFTGWRMNRVYLIFFLDKLSFFLNGMLNSTI